MSQPQTQQGRWASRPGSLSAAVSVTAIVALLHECAITAAKNGANEYWTPTKEDLEWIVAYLGEKPTREQWYAAFAQCGWPQAVVSAAVSEVSK